MRIEGYERRLEKLQSSLDRLTPGTWAPQELITAMEAGTATPMQLEQVWLIAKEDIRTQVIRIARNRWLFYQEGHRFDWNMTPYPVSRAIETLSYPPDVELEMEPQWVQPYTPEVWGDPEEARRRHRHVFDEFKLWSRTFLMKRLLGEDGGLSLRHEIGQWIDGGEPPIDENRFPHESVYWLILPIDDDPGLTFDARMLRLPTIDLFHKIGNYPSWGGPGQDWTLVDNTGFERFDGSVHYPARKRAHYSAHSQGYIRLPGDCGDTSA